MLNLLYDPSEEQFTVVSPTHAYGVLGTVVSRHGFWAIYERHIAVQGEDVNYIFPNFATYCKVQRLNGMVTIFKVYTDSSQVLLLDLSTGELTWNVIEH